jgi:hypothetical protein
MNLLVTESKGLGQSQHDRWHCRASKSPAAMGESVHQSTGASPSEPMVIEVAMEDSESTAVGVCHTICTS